MNQKFLNLVWAAAILGVALLYIVDILPDWSTYLAIFTLPLLAILNRRNGKAGCGTCAQGL